MDLFTYNGKVYEGQTGCVVLQRLEDWPVQVSKLQSENGLEQFNTIVENVMKSVGLSPRYTRPDERKEDLFPKKKKDENIVFAKSTYDGKKHYYYRFYNENGIELFSLKNETGDYRSIYVLCKGLMVNIGHSYHRLDEALKWLSGLENGIIGEIERVFNESISNLNRFADYGFANILDRVDEAKAHNEPIIEARERKREQEAKEHQANRLAEEAAAAAEYEQAIVNAEQSIRRKEKLLNTHIQGKSLIMQLFRKYGINVPLKTQGWIINSLHDIYCYDSNKWSYHYCGNDSTVFTKYLERLVAIANDASANA